MNEELTIYNTGKIILEGVFNNKTTIAHAKHDLRIVINDGIKYYFFTWIKGTSAMNWVPDDYDVVKKTLNISDDDVVVYRNDSNDMFVEVPSSYRTK